MHSTTFRAGATLLAAALLGTWGCSDSGGPDTGMGFARARVLDDPSSTSPHATAPIWLSGSGGWGAAVFTGSFEGDVAVAISVDGGAWVDLGPPADVTVTAQSGTATDVHGEVQVPVGTYTRVRLTLTGFDARLAAGSTIGGLTLTSETTVALGGADNTVVVEAQVPPFTVRAGASARTEILFDLNSETWVTQAAVQAGVVADAAVESATQPACRETERPD
jgi:hypothetical protein